MSQPDSRTRFQVPWRDEPRPPEATLHGTYAFLALAHLRRAEGRAARTAYLRYRSWVCGVADELLKATGVLTPAGERFVTRMGAAAESAVT
jgi:HEXXH motif-containing protein